MMVVVIVMPERMSKIPLETSNTIMPMSCVDAGECGRWSLRKDAPPSPVMVAFVCFLSWPRPMTVYRSAICCQTGRLMDKLFLKMMMGKLFGDTLTGNQTCKDDTCGDNFQEVCFLRRRKTCCYHLLFGYVTTYVNIKRLDFQTIQKILIIFCFLKNFNKFNILSKKPIKLYSCSIIIRLNRD